MPRLPRRAGLLSLLAMLLGSVGTVRADRHGGRAAPLRGQVVRTFKPVRRVG